MTNCFVVVPSAVASTGASETDTADKNESDDARQCWLVDVGFEPGEMIDYVEREGLSPEAVLLTHAHLDHIAGLGDVRKRWPDLPILIHDAERDFPVDPMLNLSAMAPIAPCSPPMSSARNVPALVGGPSGEPFIDRNPEAACARGS